MDFLLEAPQGPCLKGSVRPPGSKSLSNRMLLMEALAQADCHIEGLSQARDTATLWRLLRHPSERLFDAGDAGTTFRFLTAFLALRTEKQILTGSPRMLQRPIGPLVEALRRLGAKIQYLGAEGFPPLLITEPHFERSTPNLQVQAQLSSQYVSALLMIAPSLPFGLNLFIEGPIVSRPYIDMTLGLMQQLGISYRNLGPNAWAIPPQNYRIPQRLEVEADWSAASYFYLLAAFFPQVDLQIQGLFPHSLQGDAQIAKIMQAFGIETVFQDQGLRLLRQQARQPESLRIDCLHFPDLAPTLATLGAALNVPTELQGLSTLKIKECDRIEALAQNLRTLGAKVETGPSSLHILQGIQGPAPKQALPTFEDHRMAMAFAPLARFYQALPLAEVEVVQKSYPNFWEDLLSLGFKLQNL